MVFLHFLPILTSPSYLSVCWLLPTDPVSLRMLLSNTSCSTSIGRRSQSQDILDVANNPFAFQKEMIPCANFLTALEFTCFGLLRQHFTKYFFSQSSSSSLIIRMISQFSHDEQTQKQQRQQKWRVSRRQKCHKIKFSVINLTKSLRSICSTHSRTVKKGDFSSSFRDKQ